MFGRKRKYFHDIGKIGTSIWVPLPLTEITPSVQWAQLSKWPSHRYIHNCTIIAQWCVGMAHPWAAAVLRLSKFPELLKIGWHEMVSTVCVPHHADRKSCIPVRIGQTNAHIFLPFSKPASSSGRPTNRLTTLIAPKGICKVWDTSIYNAVYSKLGATRLNWLIP